MSSFSAFKKCFLFFGVLLALCFAVTDLSAKGEEKAPAESGQEAILSKNTEKDSAPKEQSAEQEIPGVEKIEGSDGDPNKEIGSGGNADKANGTAPGLKGVCANAGSGDPDTKVFAQIACKALMFLIDLRVIAYIISGFGMVAFAYAAVFNKINWKHFSMIAIGLFLLSMIGPFITYFTGNKMVEINLQYGNYLGGNYNPVRGTGNNIAKADVPNTNVQPQKKRQRLYNKVQAAKSTLGAVKQNTDIIRNASKNNGGGVEGILDAVGDISGVMNKVAAADTSGNAAEKARKWGMKDLKGSIQSGLDMARGAYNTVQTAKSAAGTIKQNTDIIKNAVTNGSGGLDGILDAVSSVSGAMNNIGFAASTGIDNTIDGIDRTAGNAQDMAATNEQRAANAEKRKNGGDTNVVSRWLDSQRELINKGATVAGQATTAGHEGQKIGGEKLGDVVGSVFGTGQAVVSGMDAVK